ncbi:MAG: DUF3782 domain-containing protein [Treponema sp.]|jgi:hypothetical protein|nr:DUF3782 domain-containing protein [Treponema sp.]
MADQVQTGENWRDEFEAFMAGMRELRQQMAETDHRMAETDRRMKETDRKLGELGNRFGELAEHLVAPSIREKFNERGYHFDDISQNREIDGPEGQCAEIDILLENGEFSIAVEVKAKPLERHVDQHIKRIEVLRQHKDKRRDNRRIQGAIAGAIMSRSVRNYALRAGFYVIEQTGDTVRIDTPPGFTPREW